MFWKKFSIARKEKVDDRTHVNPTISVTLKDQIERLAFILSQPVSSLGVLLFIYGINEREVVERLSVYFRNEGIIFDKTIFFGHKRNDQLSVVSKPPTERISLRFDDDGHHDVLLYTTLLNLEDKSKTVAIIMSFAIRHPAIIESLLRDRNNRMHFDDVVIDELRKLIKFVNQKNPYKATWNEYFLEFLEGPKKRPRTFMKPMTPECVDTETYRWTLDDVN